MVLLEIHNLRVSFKTIEKQLFTAVNNLNFKLEKGKISALIGESGSGKSVASQAITGLLGDAIVEGQCILNDGEKTIDLLTAPAPVLQNIRRTQISYIFQEPMTALNPLMRCTGQIKEGMPANYSKEEQERNLTSLLKKVELDHVPGISEAYPHQLSGGQRQRIMIAMALAKNPLLLIADEPTTALDIVIQSEILSLLRKLTQTEDLSILFITHDLLSLKGFADKIAVMYRGTIVEQGNTKDILQSPQHAYTRALIESRASYAKRNYHLAEITDILVENEGQFSFRKKKQEKLPAEENSKEELLRFSNVYKWHSKRALFKLRKTRVLEDISFSLYRGESLGLIGESGSGKSTLAKLLLHIWQESKGEIRIKGKKLNELKSIASLVQLVFQDPYSSLNPKHRIGDAIREVLGKSRKEVILLLEKVGLPEDAYYKYPHEFSGGQRQRICIAKALARKPEILVLDEAVSALDVSVQARILNLLNKLKEEENLTYLLISHDMNVVSYFCNRIIVLKDGRIQETGNTVDLVNQAASDYTKLLLENSIN